MRMDIKDRIKKCILIERIERQKDYSKKIGVEDNSTFKGKKVTDYSDSSMNVRGF